MRSTTTSVDEVVAALEHDGYAVVEGLLTEPELAAARHDMRRVLARTPGGRNPFEGAQTKRVYALFAKTRAFDGPATHPLVLGVLERVLGHCQLSAPTGIEIGPGEVAQILHHDDAIYPLPRPHDEVVLNTMWALDDFTEANGATRIVPGSHRWGSGAARRTEPRRSRRRCRRARCCSTWAACGTAAGPTPPTGPDWA